MAVGTITRSVVDPHGIAAPIAIGDIKVTVSTVVGSGSYTTGGDALTPANLGLGTVLFAFCSVTGSASNNAAVHASYDVANQKLQMWSGTTLAETASTTNVSGLTVTVIAFGY